jgi:hypothetical protein
MAKTEAPITLITQTKITITPPEVKPKPPPRQSPKKRVVVVKAKAQKVEPQKVEPSKATKKKVKSSPAPEVGLAAKNQEAVKSGTVPNRSAVEPGRYDMLLS